MNVKSPNLSRTQKEGTATFQGRINRKLSRLLTVIFIVVLLIGAVSLLLARSIYLNTEEIKMQTRHIEAIDGIHVYVHRLVFAVQESIITRTVFPEEERQRIIADLKKHLDQYLEGEKVEEFPEKEKELKVFREIKKVITEILFITERLSKTVPSGKKIDDRDLRYLTHANTIIPILALEMNKIHRTKIDRSINESRNRMWVILGFYLCFILIGSVLILGSNIVLYNSIVLPIRQLVAATVELAKGDFRKRVPVASHNEIGQLAHSFNVMAERLEKHETMLQAMATQEERERIARELHDSLAQALVLLDLKVTEAESGLGAGRTQATERTLSEMQQIIDGAYDDVRQAIFGLRTMVSKGADFIPSLTEYLHDYSEMRKIPVELRIPNAEAVRFSPQVEVQLIRIIHEALRNVFRHARARKSTVKFEQDGDHARVIIEDDGKGYRSDGAENGGLHFGLKTMRERAEVAGGTLVIESAPDKGTKVIVRLPLERKVQDETDSGPAG